MKFKALLLFPLIIFFACNPDPVEPTPQEPDPEKPDPQVESRYYPPKNSDQWESISPDSLQWDAEKLEDLYKFLETNNTRAFILLKGGKIVVEKYWGLNITRNAQFTRESQWYWASAGKTLSAFLVGLAQEQSFLNIENKSSDYLGTAWTSLPAEKEALITVRHQLTMTTGLDYNVSNIDCTDPECLEYKADAGSQWFYHNGPYTLLGEVVSRATGLSYQQFTDEELKTQIGMEGTWIKNNYNNVFWSSPRDMARFGVLIANKGKWEDDFVMNDSSYFSAMTNTSQELNPSYGYLWWLNGKGQVVLPGSALKLNTSISPNAPMDMFAALGKNGQFLDIIPSEDLVLVRMGEAPDGSLVPVKFHDDIWEKLMQIL
ncbi:MAG: beta-lactamase family protein [Bacteroidia bacterium]|nr:beta-lactamase family protein [Bacteroidia bacterium]